jgi:hypothetical protein
MPKKMPLFVSIDPSLHEICETTLAKKLVVGSLHLQGIGMDK